MTEKIKISDTIIRRGVDLWVKALYCYKFDNGDNSFNGFFSESLATQNAEHAFNNHPDYSDAVEKFRVILTSKLIFLRDNHGKQRPQAEIDAAEKKWGFASELYYFPSYIGCDYSPDKTLVEAAEEAGVPRSRFSCKSDVSLYPEYITASFGYGAEIVYHHPMQNGDWLVTKLSGSDIIHIKNAVMNGYLPDLIVEKGEKK